MRKKSLDFWDIERPRELSLDEDSDDALEATLGKRKKNDSLTQTIAKNIENSLIQLLIREGEGLVIENIIDKLSLMNSSDVLKTEESSVN